MHAAKLFDAGQIRGDAGAMKAIQNMLRPGKRVLRVAIAIAGVAVAMFAVNSCELNMEMASRQRWREFECCRRERVIWMAVCKWAENHGGRTPPNLVTLVEDGQLQDTGDLVCPSGDEDKAQGDCVAQIVARFRQGNCISYDYLGAGGTLNTSAHCPLLVDVARHRGHTGGFVLFTDGQVSFTPAAEIERLRLLATEEAKNLHRQLRQKTDGKTDR